MKLIVGLGNPGEKYENTRHNVGFLAQDALIKKFESLSKTFWDEEKKVKSRTKSVLIDGKKILLAKPTTFMNDSGIAVQFLCSYYKIDPSDTVVIYDDVDLPMGKVRVRFGGGAGGHNGVQSIIDNLKTDKFLRIRLGIGRPTKIEGGKSVQSHRGIETYVLSNFSAQEKSKVKQMTKQTIQIISQIASNGIDKYMSKFNGKIDTAD